MANHNSLRLLNWNSRSLNNKVEEFFHFLESHAIDVAVVTETWLRSRNSLYHANYSTTRLDRQCSEADRGGGVAILIRRGLQFNQLDLSTSIVEAVGVSIITESTPINIVAAYYPGSSKKSHLQQFRRDIRRLTQFDQPFFIVGDFNARNQLWNCATSNKAGKILSQEQQSSNFYIHHPENPTRYPTGRGRPSTLDLVLSNNQVQMSVPITHTDLSSDHLPVTFKINSSTSATRPENTYRCYNRANWNQFSRMVNNNIDLSSRLLSDLDEERKIDDAILFFGNVLARAEEACIPLSNYNHQRNILPDEIQQLIRLRNTRRRQHLRTRDPLLGAIVEQLNGIIRSKCAEHRYRNFGEMLKKLDPGSNQFWKISRCLRNHVKYNPPLKVNGEIIVSSNQKAEAFAASFAAAHINTLEGDAETTSRVNSTMDRINQAECIVNPGVLAKPKEILSIIRSMKTKKAPGPDGIRNVILKHLPKKALVALTKILNACLRLAYFPLKWKHASVIAIPKPNKNITCPGNYRPISLLSGLSKILERLILNRLNRHVEVNEVIPHEQFGFKKGHSTIHQLVRIKQEIKRNFSHGKSTGMVLLDVEKAYDSVWQEAVVFKLHQSNCPLYLVKIISSFLSNRRFEVTLNGSTSTSHPIPFGVPQGSVLSPTLYNIFTSDTIMVDGVVYAFFADDTAFLAADKDPAQIVTKLQHAQNNLESYQRKWRIKVNATKTQTIFFTKKRAARNLPTTAITTNGQPSNWEDDGKYLGVILDSKLTFAKHVNYSIDKLDKTVRCLYSLINRRSKLAVKNKALIFKCVLRPLMTYGSPVWGKCAKSHRARLQVKQNKLLKMIYGLDPFFPTSELHRLSNTELIDDFIERSTRTFVTSCQMSANPLIEVLANQPL